MGQVYSEGFLKQASDRRLTGYTEQAFKCTQDLLDELQRRVLPHSAEETYLVATQDALAKAMKYYASAREASTATGSPSGPGPVSIARPGATKFYRKP